MGLLDAFKKKKTKEVNLTLQLNARLQPLDRGDIYEDPICDALEASGIGITTGGGTMMMESREIEFCDVEITLNDDSDESMAKLIQIIDSIRVPKGSYLRSETFEQPIGTLEGLALYINGTELPDEVYASCDINHVVEKTNELLSDSGSMYSHWEGPKESAIYYYGTSFDEMKAKIEPFLSEYPLCQKCRIEKIA